MFFQYNWRHKLSYPLRDIPQSGTTEATHQIIIELAGRKADRITSLVDSYQGKIHREMKLVHSLVADCPHSSLEELARSRYVKKLWHDAPVYAQLDVAVPTVGGSYLHELGITGKDSVIAVLDTGIYPHPDFILPNKRIIAWRDLINQKPFPYDDNGHGTHIAGIIAGNGMLSKGKYKGLAPDAKLIGVKALRSDGTGTVSHIISGIEWCLENLSKLKIKILNLSIGSAAQESYLLDPLCRATTTAWNKGLMVCVAAGNSGPGANSIDTPGINPRVITVGNIDDRETLSRDDDQLNKSSGRGPTIDNYAKPNLVAPGTNITSTWLNSSYKTLTGTSMATPVVSGAIALILEKWPSLTPDQVKRLILKNTRNLGLKPTMQGAGAIDLEKIVTSTQVKASQGKSIKRILGYHLLDSIIKQYNIDSPWFKKKRDEAIKNFLATWINTL